MYLYLDKKDCFDAVPEQLLQGFGQPEFSMMLDLEKRDELAREDIQKVRENLSSQNYHLQMPPPAEVLKFNL